MTKHGRNGFVLAGSMRRREPEPSRPRRVLQAGEIGAGPRLMDRRLPEDVLRESRSPAKALRDLIKTYEKMDRSNPGRRRLAKMIRQLTAEVTFADAGPAP